MKDIQEKREDILRICAANGGHNVRVFGSIVRGEQGADSDIDLLMQFDPGRSLIDEIAIIQDLSEFLGQPVDVVPEDALNEYIRQDVFAEAVLL